MSGPDSFPSGPLAQAARRMGTQKLVATSCVLGLVAMGLMCWSVFDPTPVPVLFAMSVGQGIGTLSLLCYLAAVFIEARRGGAPRGGGGARARAGERPLRLCAVGRSSLTVAAGN